MKAGGVIRGRVRRVLAAKAAALASGLASRRSHWNGSAFPAGCATQRTRRQADIGVLGCAPGWPGLR